MGRSQAGASAAVMKNVHECRATQVRTALNFVRASRIMKKSLLVFTVTALLVAGCHVYLDEPIASSVAAALHTVGTGQASLEIPDLLLPLVVAVTVLGWAGRFLFAGNAAYRNLQRCSALLGVVAPASYLAKEVFKFVFGRIQTPAWLLQPTSTGFHWFQGVEPYNGFPSGHMLVIAALAAVLWRSYPKFTALYAAGLVILAVSLVLTDYHFVGDVIAGAYGGLLVYELMTTPIMLKLFRIAAKV